MFLNCAALRQTHLWPLVESWFKGTAPENITKDWDLNGLDSISSDVFLTMKQKTANENGRVMFGASGMRIKVNQDVDWRAVFHSQYSDAVDGTKDGVDYVDATIPSAGPHPVRLIGIGSREMAVLTNHPVDKTDLQKWLNPSEEAAKHSWAAEWNAASGGVFTVVMVKQQSDEAPLLEDEPGAEHVRLIDQSIDLVSYGFDIGQDSHSLEVKVRLRCKDSVDPEQVLTAFRQVVVLYLGGVREMSEKTPKDRFDVFNQIVSEACDPARARLIRGESNVIEFPLTCNLSPERLAVLVADNSKDQTSATATQTAEKADKTTTNR